MAVYKRTPLKRLNAMRVSRLTIANFRRIKSASLFFPDHVVLIGDNNVGKRLEGTLEIPGGHLPDR